MSERKGEKIGWTFGWIGGFLWVIALSIVFFYQKKIHEGAIGLGIFILALSIIIVFAPWKMPLTKYWKLFLLPYFVMLFAIVWAVWASGGLKQLGVKWWNFLWVSLLFIPVLTQGKKRWIDGETKKNDV